MQANWQEKDNWTIVLYGMNEGQGVILGHDQIKFGGWQPPPSIEYSLKHKLNNQCIESGDHI